MTTKRQSKTALVSISIRFTKSDLSMIDKAAKHLDLSKQKFFRREMVKAAKSALQIPLPIE